MHTVKLAIMVLTCALFIGACGAEPEPDYSTPQKALATLVQAEADADVEAYAQCFVREEQAGMRDTNFDGPYDATKAGRVIKKGDFTVGMLEYFKDGAKVAEQPIAFVVEDGNWKASWAKATDYREKYGTKAE